jgi:hypothetical protein
MSKSRQSHPQWWVIAHQADDVEPSITITGMCPAVECDSSGYINGFPSRGLKYISGNILTPKMHSNLCLSNHLKGSFEVVQLW